MIRPKRLLPDSQRALKERLRFGGVSLCVIERSQIAEARSNTGMIRPLSFLPDSQRALKERLRLGVGALSLIKHSQVVEARSEPGILRPKAFGLADRPTQK